MRSVWAHLSIEVNKWADELAKQVVQNERTEVALAVAPRALVKEEENWAEAMWERGNEQAYGSINSEKDLANWRLGSLEV